MREWCIEHDERVSFFVPYIVLSVVLSLAAGLFWLFVLVSLHFALELYRHRGPAPTLVAGNALWSIRLDLVLLLVALTVTLYLDTVIGVLGLRAFPQASAAASRLPSLQRLIRSGVLMADEGRTRGCLLHHPARCHGHGDERTGGRYIRTAMGRAVVARHADPARHRRADARADPAGAVADGTERGGDRCDGAFGAVAVPVSAFARGSTRRGTRRRGSRFTNT